ncbi:hypothetical protein B566_EDAN014819 [Ephemera danica]|nr:hypothetical protein B566_EDAN014819 [Ephemera danica]
MRTIWLALLLPFVIGQHNNRDRELEWKCPQHWMQFRQSCYRFIKSPIRPRNEARKNCQVRIFFFFLRVHCFILNVVFQAYEADLVSVDSLEEHNFLIQQLNWQDPQHRRWYTSARQQTAGYWANDGDNTQLVNMDAAFFADQNPEPGLDYLVYSFSEKMKRWGFLRVRGDEPLLYICEVAVSKLHYLVVDDRTHEYGIDVKDPLKVPQGPYFIKQPVNAVFDESNRKLHRDVTMTCLAGGYPNPTYEWFKEDYENDRLIARKIDPLVDARYTISGGSLIISDPKQTEDNGLYHCRASNKFGSIVSESVQLAFAFIGEFNLKRSPESGNQNWAKAIYCDPPQHYPSVTYNWARDYFPNLVEEDKRVFVSYDGYLYFSALDNIDAGNYTCNVQSSVSNTGRSGPSFPLKVISYSNQQHLKFGNNFPKAFPEAPVAGQEVRLECVAFGYPVPTYNWTRKGSSLPRSAIVSNYNRVLTIPRVQVEDQGEYVCRVYNDKVSMVNSVMLTIRAEPNFTIPLLDKHMDQNGDLTWTCEAFGIPDVTYSWLRNGMLLDPNRLDEEDRSRYHMQDNVLTIKYLKPEKDQAMYQCQAKNQLKTRYSSGQLRVLSLKPSFKKRPLEPETYAAEGGNVTILCNPEAAPRPKFVWKKDGSVIGSGGTRRILDVGNLIISRNVYGSDESRGRLIVLRGPRFVVQPPARLVSLIGHSFQLTCDAISEEILDIAYIWTHNGLRLQDRYNNNYRVINIDGGNLVVVNATFAEAGEYECTVMSAVGSITTKTMVIVEGPPGPPGGIKVIRVVKKTAVIRWTDGTSNGRPITLHTLSGRTNWNRTWVDLASNITAQVVDRYNGQKEASIENVLSPWSVYEFRVSAGNELGFGLPSTPSPQYNTPPDVPYKAPSKIGGGGGKIGDLAITWER